MSVRGPQAPLATGLAATYHNAEAGGDRVPQGVTLHVKNANASQLTLTMATPGVVDGDLAVADRTGTVPATTGERFFKVPTDPAYRDPADGLVGLSWSVQTGVSFAVLSG